MREAIRYPATYRDAAGVEAIAIDNDGATLRTTIRGVAFAGPDFDMLAPLDGNSVGAGAALCACELTWQMPLPLVFADPPATELASLDARLVLGAPRANGGLDREELALRLVWSGGTIASHGRSGWFEDELVDLQRQLPAGVTMRACIGCAYSDYHPIGHRLFGGLACFRDNKAGYLAVARAPVFDKPAFMAAWDSATAQVQETDVCDEFERRIPGTGYRG